MENSVVECIMCAAHHTETGRCPISSIITKLEMMQIQAEAHITDGDLGANRTSAVRSFWRGKRMAILEILMELQR